MERIYESLIARFHSKYGQNPNLDALKLIIGKELKIPCYEVGISFLGFKTVSEIYNNRDIRQLYLMYGGLTSLGKKVTLAHEMGHLFLGIKSKEKEANEFASKLTGIPKWKSRMIISLESILAGTILAPLTLFNTIKNYWHEKEIEKIIS